MVDPNALSSSMEDYLEAIFHIVSEKQAARAKDIARRLNVNNSSVTGALRSLSEKGFINYAPYDLITLTKKGKEHAKNVVRRHRALNAFFVEVLGAEPGEAEETACKMEHAISPDILERLIRFVAFFEMFPRGGQEWKGLFDKLCTGKRIPREVEDCFSRCLETVAAMGPQDCEEDGERAHD
jgi:DtxR family transcriptional regulator, Mn-dependent transcriptional regulator